MKKLSFALFVTVAALMLWPAASFALSHGVTAPPCVTHQRALLTAGLRSPVDPARTPWPSRGGPLALRAATGPCTVTGKVLDFAGNPLTSVEVDLYYSDGTGRHLFDWIDTDGSGAFAFSSVPVTTNGEIAVHSNDGSGFYSWGNAFTAAGPNDFTVQPGMTGAEIFKSSDPNWNGFTSFDLETWGSAGGGSAIITGDAGAGYVMAPDYDYAVAYPWDNEGIEWTSDMNFPVTPGANDGVTIPFDQTYSGRSTNMGPTYSGNPGTKTHIVLSNWPANYSAGLYGISESPSGAFKTLHSPMVLNGSQAVRSVNVTIPTTATPGYDYDIHVYRADLGSHLDIMTWFQVASLKASPKSIRRGGSVRLSGIIPTQNHMGSHLGKVKKVVVLQYTTKTKAWHKLTAIKASGLGRYVSHLLHPMRTTWYVVLYPGDGWYSAGYTSVVRVAVR
jgi:hypothetical protein